MLFWCTVFIETVCVCTANGRSWADYNDQTFEPVFFNPNLTIMFPEPELRAEAISICNNGSTSDDFPEENRECYFDLLVSIVLYVTRYPECLKDHPETECANYSLFKKFSFSLFSRVVDRLALNIIL